MNTPQANVSAAPAVKTQNRNIILLFCALMQLSVGISYIWSVFQPHVMATHNWDASTASMTYTVCVLAFVIGGTIGGKLQARFSPKFIVILSGIFMAAGSISSAFTPSSSPVFLYVTFGIICGLGFGFTYNVAVALSQKWF